MSVQISALSDCFSWILHNFYFVRLRDADLTVDHLRRLSLLTIATTDIERISDHAENIVEYMEQLKAKKAEMSPEAAGELQEMAQNTIRSVRLALQIFSTEDYSRLDEMEAIEHTVDSQETALINSHVERLMSSACDPLAGVIFSDLVTDFERCSDHAVNLAYALKER